MKSINNDITLHYSDLINLINECHIRANEIKTPCAPRDKFLTLCATYKNIMQSNQNVCNAICATSSTIKNLAFTLNDIFNDDTITLLESHICRELYICIFVITRRAQQIMLHYNPNLYDKI